MRITGILFAALLVLALLPISSLAEKGSASPRRATPSNAERVKEERESDHTRSGKTATSSNAERDDVTDAGSMIGGDYSLTEQIIVSEAVRFNTADLFGTWTVDGVTTYRFDTDGSGALILPEHSYPFSFFAEGNTLVLEFENEEIGTVHFVPSIDDDRLVLQREEEAGIAEYTLQKQ